MVDIKPGRQSFIIKGVYTKWKKEIVKGGGILYEKI